MVLHERVRKDRFQHGNAMHVSGAGGYKQASNKMLKCHPLLIFLVISSLTINYVSCIQFWISGTWEKGSKEWGPKCFSGKVKNWFMGRWIWRSRKAQCEARPAKQRRKKKWDPPTPAIPRGVTGKGPLGNINAHVWPPIWGEFIFKTSS